MNEKSWIKSKTIVTGLGLAAAGLVPLTQALEQWISSGHSIPGLVSVVWPAAVVFAGVLVAIFRKGATTTIK